MSYRNLENHKIELINRKNPKNKMNLIHLKNFKFKNKYNFNKDDIKKSHNETINKDVSLNNIGNLDIDMTVKYRDDFKHNCKIIQNFNNNTNLKKNDLIFSDINNVEMPKKKFTVNPKDYIMYSLFGKKTEVLDLFVKYRDNLKKYLDVEEIIKKLNEIQKLKLILLEERQIQVFEELKYLTYEMPKENDSNKEYNIMKDKI